jgi:hypothetical protein
MNTNDEKLETIAIRVQKLLRLATSPNEHEAALAAAKAQELLAAYNLDMLTVEKAGKQGTGARESKKLKGGLYKWQRTVWNKVAVLNFCMYWSIKGLEKGSTYEHRVLGRMDNVAATKAMAEYLEEAIERLTRSRFEDNPSIYFSKAGIAYREGMADRICERLQEQRWEEEDRARKKQEQDASCTALTVIDVASAERDANTDFLNGDPPGTAARRRAEAKARSEQWRQEWVRQEQAEKEEAERFQREDPEGWAELQAEKQKAAERERKREERNEKRRKGSFRYKSWEPRHESYYEGREKGDTVSLHKQVKGEK